jgi:hypothetical protein
VLGRFPNESTVKKILALTNKVLTFPLCLLQSFRSSTADQSVSLSAFAYLYSEMVQYHQNRVDSISELERRLEATGYSRIARLGTISVSITRIQARNASHEFITIHFDIGLEITLWQGGRFVGTQY